MSQSVQSKPLPSYVVANAKLRQTRSRLESAIGLNFAFNQVIYSNQTLRMMLPANHCRYFVSYSGVSLPLKLVNELKENDRAHRNTFFLGFYDEQNRLIRCEKRVYGEQELLHCYEYHDNGALKQVEITDADGEITLLHFDSEGKRLNKG